MYHYVEFYKRSEDIFAGSFIDEEIININIEPAGYIRVIGNCNILVEGISDEEAITEDVDKLSDYKFSYIDNHLAPNWL